MVVWDFAKREGDHAFCNLCNDENIEFYYICGTKESLLKHFRNVYGINSHEEFIERGN